MAGQRAVDESEEGGGLEALCDVIADLSNEDFAAMADGVLAIDDPSPKVVDIFHEEGDRRVRALIEKKEHLAAVELAARSCSPHAFVLTCRASLQVHDEVNDAIRAKIVQCMEENPLLLASIGGTPPL